MVRLSPPLFDRLEQATALRVEVGGSELTVAAGVSRLGLSARWVSCLPDNPLGRMIKSRASSFGVDTSQIMWSGRGRAGLYFVEYGAAPRASAVLYDRAFSAFSQMSADQVNWEIVLNGARWFHVSGITPALGDGPRALTIAALETAKQQGCTISYDLNYRAQLWTPDQARAFHEPLLGMVDVVFTTEEDAQRVLGVDASSYEGVAQTVHARYGTRIVAVTIRHTPSVWRNSWSAVCFANGHLYDDVTYDVEVVDRLGAGDNFAAGFIYGLVTTSDVESALRLGNAFAALKHTSWSDFNFATLQETESLVAGASGLRIAR